MKFLSCIFGLHTWQAVVYNYNGLPPAKVGRRCACCDKQQYFNKLEWITITGTTEKE